MGGGLGAPKINVIQPGGDQVTQQLNTLKSSQDQSAQKNMSPVEFRKLEDSLRDHVDILQTMNAKLNNHIGQQNEFKGFIGDRLDKLENLSLNKEIEKIPTKYEMLQMDQTMKRITAEIENLQNDQMTQKELDSLKQDEADAFFKKTANDYFNKLRELDDQIRTRKLLLLVIYFIVKDDKSSIKMENKMDIIEQEIIDLKSKGRNNTRS